MGNAGADACDREYGLTAARAWSRPALTLPRLHIFQVGLEALERAMRAPTRVIVDNAGEEGAVIVGKLLENDPTSNIGYNAATGERGFVLALRRLPRLMRCMCS